MLVKPMGWVKVCLVTLSACTRAAPPMTVDRGAVFSRDHVPEYQRVASREYTESAFRSGWQHFDYVEATATDDGRTRCLDAIRARAAVDASVDVFFLSNGDDYASWLVALEGPVRRKLRLVYSTGGGGASQGAAMLELGANAYVGHPGANVAPLFYRAFLTRWLAGASLRRAVDDGNAQTKDDVTGVVMKGVATGLEAAGGPHLDPATLWAGTEARLFGDDSLLAK
jgi:hypothetical protein